MMDWTGVEPCIEEELEMTGEREAQLLETRDRVLQASSSECSEEENNSEDEQSSDDEQ